MKNPSIFKEFWPQTIFSSFFSHYLLWAPKKQNKTKRQVKNIYLTRIDFILGVWSFPQQFLGCIWQVFKLGTLQRQD
jgi:hypothetical protein